MTTEEAMNYLKHDCRKMCQDCYPEIGRGGSENCDFCNEVKAYDMAIKALEKQMATAEMNVSYAKEFPHHIALKINYSDLLNADENKFIEDLVRCITQLYRQTKTDWSNSDD